MHNHFISQSVADFAELALDIEDKKVLYMCWAQFGYSYL